MRVLNLEHGKGAECGRQQAYAAVEKPLAEQIDEENCEQIGQRRKHPAHQVDVAVIGFVERSGDIPHDEERQCAVHIEPEAFVRGVEGGMRGVKVFAQAMDGLDGAAHHCEETLVGV